MDLTRVLATLALQRAHVLLVEAPGWAQTRICAEREVRDRGWKLADSGADADILLVCGCPGVRLSGAVEQVWNQFPGPRARGLALQSAEVASSLDEAAAHLLDQERQRHDALSRDEEFWAAEGQEGNEHAGERSSQHGSQEEHHGDGGHPEPMQPQNNEANGEGSHGDEPSPPNHEEMDQEGMGHGESSEGGGMDHGGMDHGGMDMPMPGGIALAGEGEDRDGLNLDVLNVPLGPVLAYWPAGLVLHCVLQGDVITEASAEVLPPGPMPLGIPQLESGVEDGDLFRRRFAAGRCDSAGRLLSLAGWDAVAVLAERARNELLSGAGLAACETVLSRLARKVSKSRTLRFSLRNLSTQGRPDAGKKMETERALNPWEALNDWLAEAQTSLQSETLAGSLVEHETPQKAQSGVDSLPELVKGLELGAARLVVAGLNLDTSLLFDEPVHSHD